MAPAAFSAPSAAPAETRRSWKAACAERKQEYIDSINVGEVRALASSYHDGKPCTEFREPKRGSYNICYFVEFPHDKTRWVVRFPLTPVLHDVRRKLQCEISTMEYVASRTTIPVPLVRAYGHGSSCTNSNPTGKCFIIVDYIEGQLLSKSALFNTTEANQDRFYTDLADFYSQMRNLEFDSGGALKLDPDGAFRITAPISIDINATDMRETFIPKEYPSVNSIDKYVSQQYSILVERADDPTPGLRQDDAQCIVFALQDFEKRARQFASSSRSRKFVLSHGDLRPSSIILGQDFSIKGIIDWEWAGTVPVQFFVPPLWIGKHPAPNPRDRSFQDSCSRLRRALVASGSRLAAEWREDVLAEAAHYIPAALLDQHFFMTLYFTYLFPLYFKDVRQHVKIPQFFQEEGPNSVHSRHVANLLLASQGAYAGFVEDQEHAH